MRIDVTSNNRLVQLVRHRIRRTRPEYFIANVLTQNVHIADNS